MKKLPDLTEKQQKFVIYYLTNGGNASEAYRMAYDCENSSDETIAVEASRLLKNPNAALWIEYAKENGRKILQNELNYSIKACFDEIDKMKSVALDCFDKNGNPNVNVALKAVELKGKLAGHFVDKHEVQGESLSELLDKLK